MNLNLQANTCDPERLESFLSGGLSNVEERDFTLHLSTCESCRRTLQQQAAEPEAWLEAEQLLKPAPFAAPALDESVDPDKLSISSRPPLQIQNVLAALGPTDDPAMLGRLGGYEVSGVVGAGGMGVVLKAIDKSLDRTVAIKVLAPHLATSGAARKRFAREAKAAAAVLHPNVIAIHSVSNDESLPYLVMPYVRGASLQKRLDREGTLSLQEILRIGSQIAAGLAAAHAQGLVHRDIKPANILLEDGVERVTITDFGLARAVDDATITHSGVIAGTPQYMSPEQARGEPVDGRSDLFSLGSVLYAICTGRPPFRAETTYGVMRRITDDEPTSIREINPEIPAWLCSIIERLMSKRAECRFASAAEISELFEKCLAHVQQPAAVPLPQSCLSLRERSASFAERKATFLRRSLGVIAMIAVLGLGLLGVMLWQASEAPDIAGKWSGPEWGEVVLEPKEPGEYAGTYTDTFKKKPGTIELKWSRLERRYKGTWQEGKDRHGRISIRLVEDEVHGAWSTSEESGINPGNPELAELIWKRSSPKTDRPDLSGAEFGQPRTSKSGTNGITKATAETDANNPQAALVMNLGFERNGSGSLASASPVLLQKGQVVSASQFRAYLEREKLSLIRQHGDAVTKATTIRLNVDRDVRFDAVTALMKLCQEVGFQKFDLRLDDEAVEKFVLEILRTPFDFDESKGSWQGGAYEMQILLSLNMVRPQDRVVKTLLKVVDRSEKGTMDQRRLAMMSLGGMASRQVIPHLIKELARAEILPVEQFKTSFPYHEIDVLGQIGEEAKDAIPVLIKHLDSPDGLARQSTLFALVKVGPSSDEVMYAIAARFGKPDEPVWSRAVYEVGRYGKQARPLGPTFVKLLSAKPQEARVWAAQALVKSGFDEARGFDELMKDVAAGESTDRGLAATALAALGSQAKPMIPKLRAFENDPDAHVAKEVRDAIRRIEKDDRIFTHAEEAAKNAASRKASAEALEQISAETKGILSAKEYQRFEGTWRISVRTIDRAISLGEFGKDGKHVIKDRQMGDARISLDPSKTPREIDLTFISGPDKGKMLRGIYEWIDNAKTGKLLRISVFTNLTAPGDDAGNRPKDFETRAGVDFAIWERIISGNPGSVDSAPLGDEVRFSESKEVVLSMGSLKFMLDLDTGKTMDPPQTQRPEQEQMDLQTDQVQPYHYPTKLIGSGLLGREVKSSDWDASAAEVRRALAGKGVEPLKEMDLGPEKNPTYFFKTKGGARGVLQLLELVDEPKGIKLRYKTLETAPAGPKQSSAEEELEKFQGSWVLVSSEKDGEEKDEAKNPYGLTFTGTHWKVHRGDEVAIEGTLTLVDVASTPRKLDLFKPKGLGPDPTVDYGIYEWKENILRYCVRNGPVGGGFPGGMDTSKLRPTELGSKDGDGRILYVWKRAEPAPASAAAKPDERSPTAAPPKWMRRMGTVKGLKSIAYSPDGKFIAVANGNVSFPVAEGWKRSVVILHAETGETVISLPLATKEENAILAATAGLPHFEVGPLAFSPDGTLLAVGTGLGQVKLISVQSGELVLALDDEREKLAEKKTPANLKSLKRAMGGVGSLAFSPDGNLLAMTGSSFEDVARNWGDERRLGRLATGPGRLKVWDVKAGTIKHDLAGHSHALAVSFSADGNLLASAGRWSDENADGNGVIIWNSQTGKTMSKIVIEANSGTHAVVFSPTNKLVAIGSRQYDKENDTYTTSVIVAYALSGITEWKQTFPGWANPKAVTPDGKSVVVLCGGESIRFIKTATGEVQHEIKCADFLPATPRQGSQWIDFAISPTGPRLVIGGVDKERIGTVEIWDLAAGPGAAANPAPAKQ